MSDTLLSKTIASTATLKIANIHSHDLFYTPIEERFERITRLARRALHAPVAAISLLNEDKQWFKSAAGWGISELPRDHAICKLTVEANQILTIGDTLQDARVAKLPVVASAPRFRAYAGHPLVDEHGNCIGTFCVFDLKPREFGAADRQTLTDLAALAQRELLSDQLTTAHAALTSKLGVARREALMDPLTHLWNRRGASVLLKAAFANADQRGTPLALALLDLDNFKRVNDNHGHQTGDEVLAPRREPAIERRARRRRDLPARRRRVLGPDGRYRRGHREPRGGTHPARDHRHCRAHARRSDADQRERRLHGSPTARHDGRRGPARARRSSADAVESRWPQSRADDQLIAAVRP